MRRRLGAAPAELPQDDGSKAFLATLSAHTDRPGDTANLNPQFATRLAGPSSRRRPRASTSASSRRFGSLGN